MNNWQCNYYCIRDLINETSLLLIRFFNCAGSKLDGKMQVMTYYTPGDLQYSVHLQDKACINLHWTLLRSDQMGYETAKCAIQGFQRALLWYKPGHDICG